MKMEKEKMKIIFWFGLDSGYLVCIILITEELKVFLLRVVMFRNKFRVKYNCYVGREECGKDVWGILHYSTRLS